MAFGTVPGLSRRAASWLWRVLGVVVIGFGLVAEFVGPDADRPALWVADFAVGVALAGAGVLSSARARSAGALLIITSVAWYAGTALPEATYWHRGVLAHLLVTYPGVRPGSRPAWLLVLIGYLVAVGPLWRDDRVSVVAGSCLLALSAHGVRRAQARRQRVRRIACWTGLGLTAVVVAGACARLVLPPGAAATPSLLVYEAALAVAAVGLWHGCRRGGPDAVTDLVVELRAGRSTPLADALADRLGDPTVRLGYWRSSAAGYVDDAGEQVRPPALTDSGIAFTRIDRDGQPFAALLHDAAVERNSIVVDAVAAADRLMSAHAALQADIRIRVAQVAASRRRIQRAVDLERRHLERRLATTTESRLAAIGAGLRQIAKSGSSHVSKAVVLLERTMVELHEIARGLYPRELTDGLPSAVRALAARCPVPVEVSVVPGRFGAETEVAVYYLCAEALTNVAKHATASAVHLAVSMGSGVLVVVVADDGVGGAAAAGGSGIVGLTDRVESAGGTLLVESSPGAGTTLTARLPLDDQRR